METRSTWCWRCLFVLIAIPCAPLALASILNTTKLDLTTLNWDGVGAVASFLAAGVALWLGVRSIRVEERTKIEERQHRFDRASTYAVMFDHELSLAYSALKWAFQHLDPDTRERNIDITHMEIARYQTIAVPVLEKLIEHLHVFPRSAGMALGAVVTGLGSIQRNRAITLENFRILDRESRGSMLDTARKESATMMIAVFHALVTVRHELAEGRRSGIRVEKPSDSVVAVWLSTLGPTQAQDSLKWLNFMCAEYYGN